MTEVDRMGKFHKAIELQGSGTFLLAVNIVGHGAPTEHTEAEPGMIYMDVDSENGDLYKCIKVTITEQGSIWLWKKLVESQELEILKKEIATKANKTGWTANKYLGTDADGNMVEKEAPQTGTGGITEETDPTVPAWAKEPEKPTYTASEVGALPASTEIPANTSDLNNDSGYITIAVATLLNYYLKTEVYAKAETYSQTEVDNLISGLDKRLNAIADSEDVDLDQFSELVAYIKANKSLIDSITTSKVNVADIIDNLTTADSKKPLSAAQGKALKALYDAIPAWAKESSKPSYSKSDVGLGNVDNVRQYSASNPPPYPVKSVNGKTGAVTLGAADVGAATAEQFGQLSKEITDLEKVLTITSDELAAMSQEELTEKYEQGVRLLVVGEGENLVPTAISPSGVVLNGCGYLTNYRINSSGEIVESERAVLTGFMPYEYGRTIEIIGGLNTADNGGQYIATYDSAFNLLYVNYLASLIRDSGSETCGIDNIRTYTVNTSAFAQSANINGFKAAAYIRISISPGVGGKLRVRYI